MTNRTEKEPDTLLPCPFCGSNAEFERRGNYRQSNIIVCTDCGCRLETGETFRQGEIWNTRPAPPRCDAQSEQAGDVQAQFNKWWDENQVDPLHGMIARNCALAAWHAAYERALSETKPAQAAWVCPKCGSRGTTDGTSSTLRAKPAQGDAQSQTMREALEFYRGEAEALARYMAEPKGSKADAILTQDSKKGRTLGAERGTTKPAQGDAT